MASSPMIFGVNQARSSGTETERLRGRLPGQLRAWLPALVCVLVFAVESTPYFGSDRTSAPLQRVAEAIFGYGVGVHWESIHYLIRKTGHFMGYGVFCLLCFRGFWMELEGVASRLSRQLRAHGLAIVATFLVAGADEFHQSFLANRSGQFSDVLLDTCGGMALGLVLFLAMQAAESLRQARARAAGHCEPACAETAA